MKKIPNKGLKVPRQKEVFTDFACPSHSSAPFEGLLRVSDFWNPWGKVVVSDLKSFAHKGCKITAQKNYFFGKFCLTSIG